MRLLLIVIIGHLNIILSSCHFSDKGTTADRDRTLDSFSVTKYGSSSDTSSIIDEPEIRVELKVKNDKIVNTENDSPKAPKKQEKKTLREVYNGFFPVGTAIEPGLLKNPSKAKFIASQYSSVTATNQMKPIFLQPKEGMFTWTEADKVVKFAEDNNMKIRGHCLVWSQRMPDWFLKDGDKAASKELVLSRMKKHIVTVLGHFKNKAYCWDVVNEAVNFMGKNPMDPKPDALYNIVGEEYIEKAFQYARQANPTIKLFYNDNGCENPKKRDLVYQLLKKLKAKGIPIDGVGLQGHWGIEGVTENYLQETIDMFAAIGIEVQITELDISIYQKRKGGLGTGGIIKSRDLVFTSEKFTNELQQKQAEVYNTIFKVFRKNKGKVTGITFWSPYDRDNYLTKKLNKKNYPYIFNENLTPKAAFYKITTF